MVLRFLSVIVFVIILRMWVFQFLAGADVVHQRAAFAVVADTVVVGKKPTCYPFYQSSDHFVRVLSLLPCRCRVPGKRSLRLAPPHPIKGAGDGGFEYCSLMPLTDLTLLTNQTTGHLFR